MRICVFISGLKVAEHSFGSYHSLNNCVRKVPAKKLKLGREQLQGTPFCILRLFCRLCPFPWQHGVIQNNVKTSLFLSLQKI